MNILKPLILGFLLCFATADALAQRLDPRQQSLSPDKLLALGDYHYRNNDVSDIADRLYKQAIKNAPDSQTAGYAQYNRGSYWFRKYYVVKEQYSKEDPRALVEAEGQYYDFIDKFARRTNTIGLLADAEFNLALVYLQQGKTDYATGWLNRMASEAANEDKSVRVYKVIWSSNAADTIDKEVDAHQLAIFTRDVINKGLDFKSVVYEIKRWCQRQ